jgi:hypothetical protein
LLDRVREQSFVHESPTLFLSYFIFLVSFKMRAQTELDSVRAKIRKGLRAYGTNVEQNDGDPTGDGDQSPVHLDENGKQFYRDLFAEGGDLNECVEANVISTFGKCCVSGNARAVKSMLQEANNDDKEQAQPSAALIKLLETRETSMRFSPLLMVVSMVRISKHEIRQPVQVNWK